jgi:hypothetical protein
MINSGGVIPGTPHKHTSSVGKISHFFGHFGKDKK